MEAAVLDKGGGQPTSSYAQKLAGFPKNTPEEPKKFLDRNVIIIKITQEVRKPTLPIEMFANLCGKLRINVETDGRLVESIE